MAATEDRIFVTFDVKDFPVIARRWAEAGHTHAVPRKISPTNPVTPGFI
jgi:hypothetical protein